MMKLPATKRKCLFWFDDVSGDGYHDDLQFDHKRINWEIIVYGHTLQLVLGFVIAFLLESFVVGPIAKKIVFPYCVINPVKSL